MQSNPSSNKQIQLEQSWLKHLETEFSQPYFKQLTQKLVDAINFGQIVFPPPTLWFECFKLTPFDTVKVVIVGQDPYHGVGQAHGLCFSVPTAIAIPPSLNNIFKELNADIGCAIPQSGDLTHWAKQGVLLLNTTLTVEQSKPASHQSWGWSQFTDKVISTVSELHQHCVFLLWGQFAKSKAPLIDAKRHLILTAAHPSPFSAHNGFFGCRHFSKANQYLLKHHKEMIDW